MAGITSSVSLGFPAIAFLEDEFKFSRNKAVAIFDAFTFIACHAVIFGLVNGVMDEMDFWGGTVCLVIVGLIETLLFGWVLGIDQSWTELHAGSHLKVPRAFQFIIKYITPAFLVVILGVWAYQEWIPIILMENVPKQDIVYVHATRFAILALAMLFVILVKKASLNWRFIRKEDL